MTDDYPLPAHTELFQVHYNKVTGEIRNWGNDDGAEESFAGPEFSLARFENTFDLNPEIEKIDVAIGKVINKSEQEIVDWFLLMTKQGIAGELFATDQYMAPDRPLSEEDREQWKVYRQALRDLEGDAREILLAWPLNPKGEERNALLKAHLLRNLNGVKK